MATWRIHNNIAIRCKDILNVDNLDDYLIGAIYPDLPKIIDDNDILSKRLHMDMGKSVKGSNLIMDMFSLPNYGALVASYGESIPSSNLLKGWLTHIVADFVFDDYMNHKIIEIKGDCITVKCVNGIREFQSYKDLRPFKHDNLKAYSRKLSVELANPDNISDMADLFIRTCTELHNYTLEHICNKYEMYMNVDKYSDYELSFLSEEEFDLLIERTIEYVDDIYKRLVKRS